MVVCMDDCPVKLEFPGNLRTEYVAFKLKFVIL